MEANVFWNIVRTLLFYIDYAVYSLVDKVYSLFLEIANTTIFTNEMIEAFAGKVYALVGIFMLFKVSFSILTYIVNPSEFADKSKGMSKLVTNIITSLVMLIAVPFVFNEMMDIQRIVLKDDVIPKIFSTEFEDGSKINISSQDPGQGSHMALITFKTFYSPQGNYPTLADIFSTDVNAVDASNRYITEYNVIISTVVGVVLVLLLISFCFDIAVRSIKLGFLRLIAPVPIIARVDPKKGNELFGKWTKNCLSTYLDLFMRLIAIFFAIYIIKAMEGVKFVDAVTGESYSPGGFTMVFIIIGALMFAKQLPKLIEDLLGIKLSGTFSLNPMKRLSQVPLASVATGAALGAAGALGSNIYNGIKEGRGIRTVTSALAGTISGGFRGGAAGLKDKEHLFKPGAAGVKGAVDARNLRYNRQQSGDGGISGMIRRAGVGINNFAGIESGASKFDKQLKVYDDFLKEQSNLDSYVEGEIAKGKLKGKTTFDFTDVNGKVFKGVTGNVNVLKNNIESLKASGASATAIANAELAYKQALAQAKIDYIDQNPTDGAIQSMMSNMEYIRDTNKTLDGFTGMGSITSGAAWDNAKKAIKGAKSRTTSSAEYRQEQINRKNDSKK